MKKYFKYLIPSFFTLSILCLIFYINNLYPFGNYSMVQVDADFQYIPILYRIYDFLHGCENIIYDDIGNGNNIYVSLIIQGSIFSPINLLLLFINRNDIVNFFNILVMVKISLISLTTFIYLNGKFKISYFYKFLFSVLYSLCGFIILNYFNIMWLDCVILFPLIMHFLDKLIFEKKYLGYIITLSMSLIISYYISYFILVFIIFYSFIYLYLYVLKEVRKKIIFRLGINTLIAILISCFSILPSIYQMIISSRFAYENSYLLTTDSIAKSLYLFLSPLFIILFFKLILKFQKKSYFYFILFILFAIGIMIEPVNIAIHGGSYWDFPYRYGFITVFIMLIGSSYYIENFNFKNKDNDKFLLWKVLGFLFLNIILIYFYNKYIDGIIDSRIFLDFADKKVYFEIIAIIIIIGIINIVCLTIKNNKVRCFTLLLTNTFSVIIFCLFTIYYNSGYFLSTDMNNLNNKISFVNNSRYKIDYNVYTPDYGFILNVSALDNWLHLIPQKEIDAYYSLGYRIDGTFVSSNGGTIFSDWLLGISYIISDKIKDSDVYQLIDSSDSNYLYKYRYSSNNGIIYNSDLLLKNSNNSFEIQNEIYKNLFNSDKDIIKVDNYSLDRNDDAISYSLKDKGLLYIDTDMYEEINYIKVNDNYIYDIGDYICELGVYEGNVNIYVDLIDDNKIDFSLGYIKLSDIDNLESVVEYKNKEYYIDNDIPGSKLFLPINKIDGIKVYINDKNVMVNNYFNNFISIDLENGINKIRIEYKMPMFILGIILSAFGIILLLLYKYIREYKLLLNIFYYSYFVLVICLFVYFYFYSMVKYLF